MEDSLALQKGNKIKHTRENPLGQFILPTPGGGRGGGGGGGV